MSLKQYSPEEIKESAWIELVYQLFVDRKEPMEFQQLLSFLQEVLGCSEKEVRKKISQFYTDLNIDGRFLHLGENRWGLRDWYPVDQAEEEVVMSAKPKSKTKKKKTKKAAEHDDYDDSDEEEVNLDDLDDFEENEDLLEDDDESDDFDDDEDEDEEEEDVLENDDLADVDEDDLDDADEENPDDDDEDEQ
ncbi:DNA-directed RNA polymerase subunit delta [Bacillus fonticola]|uniref:DNA-directed RNA polymerase subunit delta n=1 Tax=Bacillus fonticola TaxID=2728853 RepID=UPI001473C717|nr:DNA-directed RNA polymerase subunit delta [Bacillus fonticola]